MSLADATFSNERKFGPVRLSQEQLIHLVNRLRALAEPQGTGAADRPSSQTMWLSDGQSTVKLSGDISVTALDSAPSEVTSVNYKYHKPGGTIDSIDISLQDHSRRVVISGHSQEQMEAAASFAATLMSSVKSTIGDSDHRFFAGLILVILANFLSIGAFLVPFIPVKWAMILTGPMLAFSTWLLPWDRWLPGTAVYRGTASFMVRNAARISFVGVVITIVTFFLSVALSVYLARGGQVSDPKPMGTESK